LEYLQKLQTTLLKSASMLKVASDALPERLESLVKDLRELKKKAAGQKGEGVGVDQLLGQAEEIAGVKVIIAEVPGGPNDLRQLIDLLRRKAAPLAVMLGNKNDEEKKVTLIAGLTRDLVEKKLDAVAWVRSVSSIVGGSGGGRPDMAQAGGKIPEKLTEAFAAAKEAIGKMLGK
jgi:alanyl-tRNA synthetase